MADPVNWSVDVGVIAVQVLRRWPLNMVVAGAIGVPASVGAFEIRECVKEQIFLWGIFSRLRRYYRASSFHLAGFLGRR